MSPPGPRLQPLITCLVFPAGPILIPKLSRHTHESPHEHKHGLGLRGSLQIKGTPVIEGHSKSLESTLQETWNKDQNLYYIAPDDVAEDDAHRHGGS